MKRLEPPDIHHVKAAEGWLELGNHQEANEELKKIGLQERFHPQVMLVRWEIYARIGHWEFAHTIAQGLVTLVPNEAVGWINRSYALHALKRTREAFHDLLPAALKFPKNSTVAYNLACYACQLGQMDEALNWLDRSIAVGNADQIKSHALDDPDLKPLWSHLLK